MPFCTLKETEVLKRFKLTFTQNKALRAAEDLQYFYNQLDGMTLGNISRICHKVVRFGKVEFKARLVAHRESVVDGVMRKTVLEEMVSFEAFACNDKAFAAVNKDRYFFIPNIGGENIEQDDALVLGKMAAKKFYKEILADKGYQLDDCLIDQWLYLGKGAETYTEYTFVYDCMGEQLYVKAVGFDDVLTVINEPKRAIIETKKKGNPWKIIIPLLLVAGAVAGVVCWQLGIIG